MIYGLIFLGHATVSSQQQSEAIRQCAKKYKFRIDKFISYKQTLNTTLFKPGDILIFFAWNCISAEKALLNAFIKYALKNDICIYTASGAYCIDKTKDYKQLLYAFNLYEEIRVNFRSGKSVSAIKKRIASGKTHGRIKGSTNSKHAWDGKEKKILAMYSQGATVYAIAKKLKLTSPTVKRFLITQN